MSARDYPYPRPPAQPRRSAVDELLEAIDRELVRVRSSKALRAHYPAAAEQLVRNHEAARAVVEATTYTATVRPLARPGVEVTRRPHPDPVARDALEAIANAYGVAL